MYYPDVIQFSPLRPTDWRWRRATALVDRRSHLHSKRDDGATIEAVRFLRLMRRNPSRASTAYPTVHAAHELHEGSRFVRNELEARVLARQSSMEIACVMNVRVPVVDTFESLFFHTRDRFEARDWITVVAIGCRAKPDLEALTKLFAFFGGPLVLDAVLECFHRRDHGADAIGFDPVGLAIDALTMPHTTATDRLLTRIRLELMAQGYEQRENRGVPVQKTNQVGLSAAEIAREMRAFTALTTPGSGPITKNEPTESLNPSLAIAV